MKHSAKHILLLLLISFQFWFGIKPGLERPQSDFPNYYTSSRMILQGISLSDAYDDAWFQEKISAYGFQERGKFSPFPPPTAFAMLPMAWLQPMYAKYAVTLVNIGLLFLIALLFRRISKFGFTDCLIVLLLTGIGLANNFLLGQFYLCLLLLVTFGYILYLKNSDSASGLLWGAGMAVKYVPFIFIPFMILEKRWKAIVAMLVVFIASNGLAMFCFGIDVYKGFISSVLFNHINGDLSSQSPYAYAFQSWNSFLRNCFVFDPDENPQPLIDSVFLFNAVRVVISSIYITTAAVTIIKVRRHSELMICVSLLFLLAILPASATYHYVLLSFPFILLINWLRENKGSAYLMLLTSLYASVGFLPFIINELLEGYELPLVLAFHRLWIITAFYFACIFSIHSVLNNNNSKILTA